MQYIENPQAERVKAEWRFALVRMSSELFWQLTLNPRLEGDKVVCCRLRGLPEDALMVGVHFDWQYNQLVFRYYHPSFEVVKEGEPIPTLEVQVEEVELNLSSLAPHLRS